MEVALIGLHKRFCDEAFFEKVYNYVTSTDFQSDDIVLLLTCNRIEIYLASPFISDRHPELLEKIKQPFEENVEKRFYTLMGSDVPKHLAQVASGLDSLICGESDIQHQVKKAYEQMGKSLNKDGHFLFQKALHIAKKLRSEFDIKPAKSLIDQVIHHLEPFLEDQTEIVFVGNSDLNQRLYQKMLTLLNIKATIVSSMKPFADSIFGKSKYVPYDQLHEINGCSGVILATQKRLQNTSMPLKTDGFICDLSRPKAIIQKAKYNFDLNFFEDESSKMALKQYFSRCDALDYIHNNVKRLLDTRLDRFSMGIL